LSGGWISGKSSLHDIGVHPEIAEAGARRQSIPFEEMAMPNRGRNRKQLIRELAALRRQVKSLKAALGRLKSKPGSAHRGGRGGQAGKQASQLPGGARDGVKTRSAPGGADLDGKVDREVAEIKRRLRGLSPRQREVLGHVVAGRLNKQTAALLGISEKTVKVHRGRVMQKMQAGSLAELVRDAQVAGINHFGRSRSRRSSAPAL
jgi:DNA-binding CsgD family transcriptional regulator